MTTATVTSSAQEIQKSGRFTAINGHIPTPSPWKCSWKSKMSWIHNIYSSHFKLIYFEVFVISCAKPSNLIKNVSTVIYYNTHLFQGLLLWITNNLQTGAGPIRVQLCILCLCQWAGHFSCLYMILLWILSANDIKGKKLLVKIIMRKCLDHSGCF